MLSKSFLLGACGLIPMSLAQAVPNSVPTRIDLDHRLAPNMKPRSTVQTISEADVSGHPRSYFPWNPQTNHPAEFLVWKF
jgi:hypothetical protein